MTRTRKSALAAVIVGGMIALAAGCMQTKEIDETMPPYASMSDEGRSPAAMATPGSSDSDYGGGGVMSAIGSALMVPVHLIFW